VSRYAQAKLELERALVDPKPRPPTSEPVRYAAITVMQPYAWLIAHASSWPDDTLGKTIENRSRPTDYRGPVLIHVSRRWEHVAERVLELRRLGLVGRGCPEPNFAVMRAQLGRVIAVGELVGCRRIHAGDVHPWAHEGAWGWELADVELVRPFGLRGHTNLWFAPPGIRVQRLAPTLELAGLPVPRRGAELGLRVDPSTGTASIKVASFTEAARVVSRVGVRRFDYVVGVNGRPLEVRDLMVRAAAELGDHDAQRWLQAWSAPRCEPAPTVTCTARGPRRHGCEHEPPRGARG
jgi:hypothetical protein